MKYYSFKLVHKVTKQITFSTYGVSETTDGDPMAERLVAVKELAEGDDAQPEDYDIIEPIGYSQDMYLDLTKEDWQTMVDNLLESYNRQSNIFELIPKAFEYIYDNDCWKYYRDILKMLHDKE